MKLFSSILLFALCFSLNTPMFAHGGGKGGFRPGSSFSHPGYGQPGYNHQNPHHHRYHNKGYNNKGYNNKGYNKGYRNKGYNNKGYNRFNSPYNHMKDGYKGNINNWGNEGW